MSTTADVKPRKLNELDIVLGGPGGHRKIGRVSVDDGDGSEEDAGTNINRILAQEQNAEALRQANELKIAKLQGAVSETKKHSTEAETAKLLAEAGKLKAQREMMEEQQKIDSLKQPPQQQQAYGYSPQQGPPVPSVFTPEMIKTLTDMPEEKRGVAYQILQSQESANRQNAMALNPAYQQIMMLETLKQLGRPQVTAEAAKQVNPMELVSQTIDVFQKLQGLTQPTTAIKSEPSMVDDMLRNKLAEFISAKIGESLGLGPQNPTVVDTASGAETTMLLDQTTGQYYPSKVTYETWEKIEEKRQQRIKENEERQDERNKWKSIENTFLKPLSKTTLPKLGQLADRAMSGFGKKGRGGQQQAYTSPPQLPRQGAFACKNCGTTVTYPLPPPEDYIAVCQNCGMEFQMRKTEQRGQAQQAQQAQQQMQQPPQQEQQFQPPQPQPRPPSRGKYPSGPSSPIPPPPAPTGTPPLPAPTGEEEEQEG